MNMLIDLLMLTALTGSVYVTGAAICRLRHGSLSYKWATLYAAILGNALWTALDIIQGQAGVRDAMIAVITSAYMHLTRQAWSEGVPHIAQDSTKTAYNNQKD